MKKLVIIIISVSLAAMNVLAGGPDGRSGDRGGGRGVQHYSYQGDHWVRNTWLGVGATVVGALALGAIAESMPPRYTTVVVGHDPYYYHEGNYFRPAPGGYVVVPAPVVQQQPVMVVPAPPSVVYATPAPVVQASQPVIFASPGPVVQASQPVIYAPSGPQQVPTQQTTVQPSGNAPDVTVNIPNDKGAYTPVSMKRSGSGFVGPQGEFYPEFPRVENLKLMYGR